MVTRLKSTALIILLSLLCLTGWSQQTFTNPLLSSGADPWSIYYNGFYYYTNTLGDSIVIWKTKSIANLRHAERTTVFVPPSGTSYSKELWAPEIHLINNKWYIYFAADNGNNNNHRLYVLMNTSNDPMSGQWIFKGKISDRSDRWAIDGSVFSFRHQRYMIWSGWEGNTNGSQDIYIAKMRSPTKIKGRRHRISTAIYDWEKFGDLNDVNNPPHVNVNEGPQSLQHNKKLFIIYSASGCWTDQYSLGMLTYSGKGKVTDSSQWHKSIKQVFNQSVDNKVFAPGHNSFFKSPDGKEDWILYHANDNAGEGCGRHRSPRAQPFSWNGDGTPYFGVPVEIEQQMKVPGE
ncbi:MAG: glycoside hydrolase family 43 protein [Ginsengibacter sp.]